MICPSFSVSEAVANLYFKATRGPDPLRFVSIDDITVSEGSCVGKKSRSH